jgi:type II secretory ATPase GspE/PulE/Tfp pilus assembly ATPase PilB-like protein
MTERNEAGPRLGEAFRAALDQIGDDDRPDYQRTAPPGQDVPEAEAPPIVRIAHTIIQQAIQDEASEIVVEPRADSVTVLFRIGGGVREATKLPKRVQRKLVARYKYMADMKADKEGAAQDGPIAISHAGKEYDLRVHAEPTPNGDRITIGISVRP